MHFIVYCNRINLLCGTTGLMNTLIVSLPSVLLHVNEVLVEETAIAVDSMYELLTLNTLKEKSPTELESAILLTIELVPSLSLHRTKLSLASHVSCIVIPGKTVKSSASLVTF